jgi:hypothetical protein
MQRIFLGFSNGRPQKSAAIGIMAKAISVISDFKMRGAMIAPEPFTPQTISFAYLCQDATELR